MCGGSSKETVSLEITALKGLSLQFHRRVQGDESIKQLGMDLQKLGHI